MRLLLLMLLISSCVHSLPPPQPEPLLTDSELMSFLMDFGISEPRSIAGIEEVSEKESCNNALVEFWKIAQMADKQAFVSSTANYIFAFTYKVLPDENASWVDGIFFANENSKALAVLSGDRPYVKCFFSSYSVTENKFVMDKSQPGRIYKLQGRVSHVQ